VVCSKLNVFVLYGVKAAGECSVLQNPKLSSHYCVSVTTGMCLSLPHGTTCDDKKPVCVECLYSEPTLLGVHPQDKFLGTPLSDTTNKCDLEVLQFLDDSKKDLEMLNRYPIVKKLFVQHNAVLPSSAPVE